MKKMMKKIKTKLNTFFKNRFNLVLTLLTIGVFILGCFIIGLIKTIIIFLVLTFLLIMFKTNFTKHLMAKIKKKNKPKKDSKKKKKFFSIIFLIGLIVAIIVIICGFLFMGYVVSSSPKFDKTKLDYKEASIIYTKDGKELIRFGYELRDKVTYDELSEVFIDAIIATEDSRFFSHNGFDAARFLKASFGQALGNSGAGGASTISMQVVKNNFTSFNISIVRKFTDIYLAVFKLEKTYSKEEILEFYVNNVHLGIDNSYGVGETSKRLFGKDIKDINLSQAALLAGMFQAPSAYNPYKYPEEAAKRRNTVLNLMVLHGYITKEERDIASNIPIENIVVNKAINSSPYQGYIDYAIAEAKEKTGYDPYEVAMKIYINLDINKQDYLNSVLDGTNFKFPDDVVQSGIAVTNVHTGEILALGSGRNQTGVKVFNYATDIKRQLGSAAKPVFDYGPAMEYNNYSTYTLIVDDKHYYSNGTAMGNWDSRYLGMMTTRNALAQSRNIPALKTFQSVDNKKIVSFVTSLGIKPEIEDGRIHEAHSIGGFNGVDPLTMAAAYAAFANGGYYIKPYAVNKIEIIETNEVSKYKSEKIKVMSDSTAFMITDILRYGVSSGLIGGGKVSGVEVAAKSGTTNFTSAIKKQYGLRSNAINDLWYVGYSPDYAIGMWYGYDKILKEYHNTTSKSWPIRDRLFTTIAKGIFEKNGKTFKAPASVVEITVEKGTIPAMLPSPNTPGSMLITEYFKKGTEPTEVSPRFSVLNSVKNLTSTIDGPTVVLNWSPVSKPDMITPEYLKTIGKLSTKYLGIHQNKDDAYLGTLGYSIYLENNDGSLKYIDWTASTSYSYTPTQSGTLKLIVKASYSIFKAAESNGVSTSIVSPYSSGIIMSLVGLETIELEKGDIYQEPEKTLAVIVTNNDVPVTNDATITKVVTSGPSGGPYIVVPSGVINTNIVTTYKINYTVSYGGRTNTLLRTININDI